MPELRTNEEPTEVVNWYCVAMLLIYEHTVLRPDDLTRVNVAFFQVNAIISIGLLVVGAIDLWT